MDKMRIQEAPEDVYPLCPSCKRELRDLWKKTSVTGLAGVTVLIFCPHCHICLSIDGFG